MRRVSNSSAALILFLSLKNDWIFDYTWKGFKRSCTVKPRSAKTKSYGLRCFKRLLSLKMWTSSISPSNKSETKYAPPLGVYRNETLECVGVLIGKQSVSLAGKIPGEFHSKFSTINNTAYVLHGFEYLLHWALYGNIKSCMSLKMTYIDWIYVVKIFPI